MNKKINPFGSQLIKMLENYDWPGNVRELRNIIERLLVLSVDGEVDIEDWPDEIRGAAEIETVPADLKNMTKAFEKEYITEMINKHNGNVAKAAEEMCIARKKFI